MKKTISLIITLFIVLFFSDSCKQNNPKPSEPLQYRVVSTKFFIEEGTPLSETSYDFIGNKISHLEKQESEDQYIADYYYEIDKAIANAVIYDDSVNVRNVRVEYIFQNGQLSEAISWEKFGNDSVISSTIQFDYENENLVEFIENRASKPYMKATYQYENDKLSKFILYYFGDNGWKKWYSEDYSYIDNLIHEIIVSVAIIDLSDLITTSKIVYHYEDDLLKHTDNYSLEDTIMVIKTYDDYTYDVHKNLVKKENRREYDDALLYYYKYQYEEGGTNLKELIYFGSIYDQTLIYPTPKAFSPTEIYRALRKLSFIQ
jgi:hypothetical protein